MLDSDEYVELLSRAVQSVPYGTPDWQIRLPATLIEDGRGVCTDKSVLLAALLLHEGYDTGIWIFDTQHHAAVAVRGAGLGFGGTRYSFIETTREAYVNEYDDELLARGTYIAPPRLVRLGGSAIYTADDEASFVADELRRSRLSSVVLAPTSIGPGLLSQQLPFLAYTDTGKARGTTHRACLRMPVRRFEKSATGDSVRVRVTGTLMVFAAFTVLSLLWAAAPAYAYDEPHGMPQGGMADLCGKCHRDLTGNEYSCTFSGCHEMGRPLDETSGKGPHGLYSSTSDRCSTCHTLHDAGGEKLLPAATVTGSCFTCHDGTGGNGVYGTILARTGVAPAGAHRIDTATIVPGGDAETGGDATMAFKGPGSTLTCDDCHSPHDSNTVAPFKVERWRNAFSNVDNMMAPGLTYRGALTSRLLRKNPGGTATAVDEYGAAWCAACHQGRMSGGEVINHPVDEATASTPVPFTYSNVALLSSDSSTSVTVLGTMAGTNRGYLMPYPRTAQQGAHVPICQQCHEDARNVGTLGPDGTSGDAATFTITTPDGTTASDNPRFQNFPHETTVDKLLVETDDDLCLNCHPLGSLP
jgi:predicted CXXCH cytochrome family protein